jgi:hypothetical protein
MNKSPSNLFTIKKNFILPHVLMTNLFFFRGEEVDWPCGMWSPASTLPLSGQPESQLCSAKPLLSHRKRETYRKIFEVFLV